MYDWLLQLLKPFVKWMGHLHFPFTHKKITGDHYYQWRDSIHPGDVLLSTTNGEISNFFNPNKIKHAALYVGGDQIKYVVEAIGKGVIQKNLVTFLTTKDRIVILRPKFTNSEQLQAILQAANMLVGSDYDYLFKPGNKKYYCYELVVEAFRFKFPEIPFKCKEIIKGKRIYDHNTFLQDPDHWEVIVDSEGEYDG